MSLIGELLEGVADAVKLWEQGTAEERAEAAEKMTAASKVLRSTKAETAAEHDAETAETRKAIDDAKAATAVGLVKSVTGLLGDDGKPL